ncbi:DUF2922 domain-containing protein [Lederbergia citrea]|uniref:DUF2922 domain-containing protein n=1 Tax=Lederbergia citrea TaxID=2833581 RepID=A0A942ULA6_9BACI|nr:DUF2922 domain-containing protein [Lederbergia citrea]MBS4176942.1 DUF2922 domain-containing protein [Lederbergia citrea]MBS4203501.1 DUF2922 domain-containing protein [Lederbergia citrea]MBS4221827.1 DUF2922 domain-containing protein [Lederbergia citrea]
MKSLELIFLTGEGKTTRIAIDNPTEPVDAEQVKTAMEDIIASAAFLDSDGNPYVTSKGARLLERNITVFEIK